MFNVTCKFFICWHVIFFQTTLSGSFWVTLVTFKFYCFMYWHLMMFEMNLHRRFIIAFVTDLLNIFICCIFVVDLIVMHICQGMNLSYINAKSNVGQVLSYIQHRTQNKCIFPPFELFVFYFCTTYGIWMRGRDFVINIWGVDVLVIKIMNKCPTLVLFCLT